MSEKKKQKLYEKMESGGIRFKSERRPWEVRIPCYVYDLWLPILGIHAIGVYAVYARLAMEGVVKKITQRRIAELCRIGDARLRKINKCLVRCGFIRMIKPWDKPQRGWTKLTHWTLEITVLDPPREVPADIIEEFVTLKGGYTPLSHWLVEENMISDPFADEAHDDDGARWGYAEGQIEAQAFVACGRERYGRYESQAERDQMRQIATRVKNGELPLRFWQDRLWSAQEYKWSFEKLLRYSGPEYQKRWEAKQVSDMNDVK